jgi:hypothetical protein
LRFKQVGKYFTIREDEPKKKFNLSKNQFHFMLNLLRENCSFDFEVIYTLCITAQVTFRSKAEGIKAIKKDPLFLKIRDLGRSIKNGISFNVKNVVNLMNWHPLEAISKLNSLALKYNGFLMKSGYAIYLKIHDSTKKLKLRMEDIYSEMQKVLVKTVEENLIRKLRRLDIFYYILDQGLKKFPSDSETEQRSLFVQKNIEQYFKMDELDFVKEKIGWENLTKSLPLEFLSKSGKFNFIF